MNLLVAGGTGIDSLGRVMSAMALEAVRYVTVSIVVTGGAALLGMGAWKRIERLSRGGVTIRTECCQPVNGGRPLRCMRVLVTVCTTGLFRAVGLAVTAAAARHQFGIVILERVVAVKKLMALLAGKAVFAPILLQAGVVPEVTLAALDRGQCHGIIGIEFFGNLGQRANRLTDGSCRPGKVPGRQDNQLSAHQDTDDRQKSYHIGFPSGVRLLGRPVVQVVRRVMAIAALRELVMHAGCMRQSVAIAALRNHFVCSLMAGDTGDLVVLRLAGGQLVEGRIMTGRAQHRTGIGAIGQFERFVGLMAGPTIVLDHGFGVRRMARDAIGDVAVGVGVAEVAGNLGMHAGAGGHLFAGTCVTGFAHSLDFTCELDFERLVGIVTAHTFRDIVVAGPFVTAAAFRDIVRNFRPMTLVAPLTINGSFMGRTIHFDLGRLLLMTFYAIVSRQSLLRPDGKDRSPDKQSASQQDKHESTQQTLDHSLLPH